VLGSIAYEKKDRASHELHASFHGAVDQRKAEAAAAELEIINNELEMNMMAMQEIETQRLYLKDKPIFKVEAYMKKKAEKLAKAGNTQPQLASDAGKMWFYETGLSQLEADKLIQEQAWTRARCSFSTGIYTRGCHWFPRLLA
jgi:hypothetical protein